MGFRFRRRVRILPGIYFNLSKTGSSVSIGGRGATLNISKAGTRTTVDLPGSGLSYRSPFNPWTRQPRAPATPRMTAPPTSALVGAIGAPLQPVKLTEEDLDIPPAIIAAKTNARSHRGLGFLFAVFLAIGVLGLAGLAALDTAMKAKSSVAVAVPARIHVGHDG